MWRFISSSGFHSFLENFPGGLRGLDVAPLVTTGSGVKILIIQRSYFVFNLGSNILVPVPGELLFRPYLSLLVFGSNGRCEVQGCGRHAFPVTQGFWETFG
jgi:hypothetical protein